MLRDIKGSQRVPRQLAARINSADGSLAEGGVSDFTGSKIGTGHFRLTLATPYGRKPVPVASVVGDNAFAAIDNLYNTYFDVKVFDDAGAALDADVNVLCLGWDTADQY